MKYLLLVFIVVAQQGWSTLYDPFILYLTWRHNPATTMCVQWISTLNQKKDSVEYQRVGETQWQQVDGEHLEMPHGYSYLIHSTELVGLTPDTDYWFRISSEGQKFKFRTMPITPITPIRFVVGGDIYHKEIDVVEQMNREIASREPQFAICGGDLSYDSRKKPKNVMPWDRPRWMEWLIAWKKTMVTPSGRLIPLVPVIGNHDVNGGCSCPKDNAPFFFSLFPLPDEKARYVLDFGNYLSLVILDSEHTEPVAGEQSVWLEQVLKERRNVSTIIPIYHVAAFPSYRNFNDNVATEIRTHWVPLFEKNGVKYAFEHHDHAFKRTHPILNGKVDPNGIVYFGDGAWGVTPRKTHDPAKTWYLAKAASCRHVYSVEIKPSETHIIAFDENETIVDEYMFQMPKKDSEECLKKDINDLKKKEL